MRTSQQFHQTPASPRRKPGCLMSLTRKSSLACAAGWWVALICCFGKLAHADDTAPADAAAVVSNPTIATANVESENATSVETAKSKSAELIKQTLNTMIEIRKSWMNKRFELTREQTLAKSDQAGNSAAADRQLRIKRLSNEERTLHEEFVALQAEVKRLSAESLLLDGDVRSIASAAMPDIAGKWNMGKKGEFGPQQIRFVPDNPEFPFEYDTADKSKVSLQWIADRQQFEGIASSPQGKGKVVLKPLDDGRKLRFTLTPVDEASKASIEQAARDNNISQDDLANLLNHEWTLVDKTRRKAVAVEPSPPKKYEGRDLIILETEDGVAGFSKPLGKWDRIAIKGPKDGRSRLSQAAVAYDFAWVIIDDQLLGFSSAAGKWGRMTIPEKYIGKIKPELGLNSLSVPIGDTLYALSPKTGQWTSPKGKSQGDDATAQFKVFPLKHGTPSLFRRMLLAFYPEAKISVDHRTNSLIVAAADDNLLGEIQAVLQRLDVPAESEPSDTQPKNEGASRGQVLVFVATWSAPCAEMRTIAADLQKNGVALQLIDIDQKPELVKAHDVKVVPTVIAIGGDGDELRRHAGRMTKEQLLEFLKPGLKSDLAAVSTLDTTSITGPRDQPRPRTDSPAARRLADEIARHEAEAAKLAEQIRNQFDDFGQHHPHLWKAHRDPNPATCLVCHGQAADQEKLKPREKLRQALASALDLKFQLEQLQIEELRIRLSQLEQQIGQRKALQQKIIDRRAEELIEGDATRWDNEESRVGRGSASPTDSAPSPVGLEDSSHPTTPTVKSKAPEEVVTRSDSEHSGTSPIEPNKMRVTLEIERSYSHLFALDCDGSEHTWPAKLQLDHDPERIRSYPLHLVGQWPVPSKLALGTLEIHPHKDAEVDPLHVVFQITADDFNQVNAGNNLLKIFYVSDAKHQELAVRRIELLVSTRLDPSLDPIAEADKRGTILAVLRLSARPQSAGEPDTDSKRTSSAPRSNATSMLPIPSYQDLVARLEQARDGVESAKRILAKMDQKNLPNIEQGEKALEQAVRAQGALHQEYHALIRELELLAESGQLAVADAQAKFDRAEKLFEKRVMTEQERNEIERNLKQAQLTLQRLQNQLELYRRAGEEYGVLPPKLSKTIHSDQDGTDDVAATEKLAWDRLGLKLRPLNPSEWKLALPKYRGGLMVTQVKAESPAAAGGIRENDILVGLEKWETVNLQNVAFVLAQTKNDPVLKFYVMRGEEVMTGELRSQGVE